MPSSLDKPDGSLAELKIHAPTENRGDLLAPTENRGDLLGRVFYDLNVKDGLLVQTFHDTSGRHQVSLEWKRKRIPGRRRAVSEAVSHQL